MDHHLAGQLAAFASYAGTLEEAIEQIESDRELARRGYQLIYAVDFSEIRRFLLPASVLLEDGAIARLPDGTAEIGLVRQQLALSFVFEHLGHDLLILPPHQIEMSDHFHMRRSLYKEHPTGDPQAIEEHLANALTDQRAFRSIAAFLEREPECASLQATQLRKLAQYVREHFMELSFVLARAPAGRTGADEPVRHLLKRFKIRPYVDYFGYSELQFDTVFEASASWFERLKDGSDPHRESAVYTDSLACAYLERTNRVINPLKEVMLFVTSSIPVAAILQERELISGECAAHHRSVVRNLNYFWALLQHHRGDSAEMDAALGRTKRLLEQLRRVLAAATAPGTQGVPAAHERSVSALLSDLARDLRSRENLGLAIAAQTVPVQVRGACSFASLSLKISEGLRSILRVATSNQDLIGRLRDDALRANADLAEHVSDLDLLLNIRLPGAGPIRQSRSFVRTVGPSVVLASPGPALPSEVSLYNPQVRRIAASLLSQLGDRGSEKAWQTLVLSLAELQERDPELHLLRAYLFATAENWPSALSEVRMAVGDRSLSDNARIEALHLMSALHRVQDQTEEGIIACTEGLTLSPSDPRLNRELAILLWQALRTPDPNERKRWSELVRGRIGQEPDFAVAFDYADRALRALDQAAPSDRTDARRPLLAHALSDCAFLALELFRVRREASYLTLAEEKMARLFAALPESEWERSFLHTMGCMLFERWDLTREHIGELRSAKRYLKEAVSGLPTSAPEHGMYDRDFERISEQLRRLGYGDQGEDRPILREYAT